MNRTLSLCLGTVLAVTLLASCTSRQSGASLDGSGYTAPTPVSSADYTSTLLRTHQDLRY